ncbi:hypothetical protein ACB092_04G117300 [Castanea dentata]
MVLSLPFLRSQFTTPSAEINKLQIEEALDNLKTNMFKVDSVGNGNPCNWPHTCDACHAAACNLYCQTDSAYLCFSCDECIHAANPQALQHHRVLVCSECENAPAAFTFKADAASLCISCNVEIHSANAIACRHNRVPVSPLTGLVYASSNTYYHCELPLPALTFDVGNEIVVYKTNEIIDEAEADSFLLLDPDNTENQTNSELMNSEAVEYLQSYQDEYSQQQSYGAHKGKNISDIFVPVPSVEARKIQQQEEQHNISFNGEYDNSRGAFINTPSSSQSVALSFMSDGISPKETTSELSCSYTRFQCGTTEILQNTSRVMPLQFNPTNREANKKIRNASRKAYAETRPRVKGRFARRSDIELEEDHLFSTEEYGYAIVLNN